LHASSSVFWAQSSSDCTRFFFHSRRPLNEYVKIPLSVFPPHPFSFLLPETVVAARPSARRVLLFFSPAISLFSPSPCGLLLFTPLALGSSKYLPFQFPLYGALFLPSTPKRPFLPFCVLSPGHSVGPSSLLLHPLDRPFPALLPLPLAFPYPAFPPSFFRSCPLLTKSRANPCVPFA